MSLTSVLQDVISNELGRQGQAGLIVWYDPQGTLAALVERSIPKGVRLLPFQGSYLALRLELERQDPQFAQRWVVYIPEAPAPESWLRDWELLGARWEMDLLELLHRKFNLSATPKLVALLRGYPQNSRALAQAWDNVIGEVTVNETSLADALLALAFGLPRWQVEQALLAFLSGAVGQRQLAPRGLWEVFTDRVGAVIGWAEVPTDEDRLRRRLEAATLLSELVDAVPALAGRLAQALPAEAKRSFAAHLAGRWRREWPETYIPAAQRVQDQYELAAHLSVSPALLTFETFPVVDDLWRREVRNAVAPDGSNLGERAQRLGEIAAARQGLFWAKQGRARYWQGLGLAASLYTGCQGAITAAEHLSGRDEFVERYAAQDGWWQLDRWALDLATAAEAVSREELDRFVRPAWRAYGRYLESVNQRFAAAVQREGWQPTQTSFWGGLVSGQKRTVVIFMDALRYDLAHHLAALLPEDEFKVTLGPGTSCLPSVTEVCMAALLPEADAGLEVIGEANHVHIRLGGEDVGDYPARLSWLERHIGPQGKVVKLDEVDAVHLAGVDLLIITSREVDAFGTFAADLQPHGLVDMVGKAARAIGHLRREGFARFLITADHGFFFLPADLQPGAIPAPAAKVTKHRFIIGANPPGCVVKYAQELGLQGSELFGFPMGLAVFSIQGGVGSFLHGGLSLQECIIPVLQIQAEAPAQKVAVTMAVPQQLTSRIALVNVVVRRPVSLFDQSRRVIVEVEGKRSAPSELGPENAEVPVSVRWLGFDDSPPREALIRLLDADSLQVLEERVVAVEILV